MPKKNKKKSLKAAVYIRVSTVEQSDNDGSSLDGQLSQCKTWIDQKNTMGGIEGKKINDYEVYKDTKSGKDLKRPGIARLMKDASEGKFDLLIVTKIDRVSRSLQDFLNFLETLEEHDVSLAVVTQDIDTTSPAGKALQRMLLVFAEFERDMVSERTSEKRLETIKAGLWPGGYQILGYDLKDRKLVVNENEAGIVGDIYKRYLKMKSASKVARKLNKDGFRNKEWITLKGNSRGGGKFHKKSVLTILKNHTYLGKYEFEGKVYEGKHEQIVDQEVFDQVQTIISQNAAEPKSNITSDTPAVLTDLCTCGFCESGMTVSSTTNRHDKKYYYYKCVQKNNEGKTKDHNPKDLPVHTLDEFVYKTLVVLLEEPELLKAMKKRIKYEGEDRIKEIEKRIKQIQDLLKSKKKDKVNALKLVTDNAASSLKETYESQLESIVLEIEEKENEIEFLSEQLKTLKQQSPISASEYKKVLKGFVSLYDYNDVDTKRDLTKVLVKNVESLVNQKTNDGTIEVQYIADKALEMDWLDIKKANPKGRVRMKGTLGSPGRIRTYDQLINSQLLCH